MRDYTDACVRYLRATGLVEVSHVGHSLSIAIEKVDDTDYILANTERSPVFVDDEQAYMAYLGSADTPRLLTDDRQAVLRKLDTEFPTDPIDRSLPIGDLQQALADLFDARKADRIWSEIDAIKSFRHFDDILNTFKQIEDNSLYDAPLMLEWNTWRAMTMLDGGDIRANLKLDDQGHPISTAQGNMADIVCDYGAFALTVEVTLQRGQKQYETEGEPVARHLAKLKRESQKPAFCLFVAPSINDAVVAHFYALQRMNITYYG